MQGFFSSHGMPWCSQLIDSRGRGEPHAKRQIPKAKPLSGRWSLPTYVIARQAPRLTTLEAREASERCFPMRFPREFCTPIRSIILFWQCLVVQNDIKNAEVTLKVRNYIRVVLDNIRRMVRQKTFTINVASNSEIFTSLRRFIWFLLIPAPNIVEKSHKWLKWLEKLRI